MVDESSNQDEAGCALRLDSTAHFSITLRRLKTKLIEQYKLRTLNIGHYYSLSLRFVILSTSNFFGKGTV